MPDKLSSDFLASAETIEAISTLSKSESLLIYCGAGATIDQTGLSWSGLVKEIFYKQRSEDPDATSANLALEHILASSDHDQQQKASIVLDAINIDHSNETDFLFPILQHILYVSQHKSQSWSQGVLLDNIAQLSIELATNSKNVTIATTNYDDFLVVFIKRLIDSLAHDSDPNEVPIPGLKVSVLGKITKERIVVPTPNGAPVIHLVFLHGLVPNRDTSPFTLTGKIPGQRRFVSTYPDLEGLVGNIVFSEASYAESRPRTANFLETAIKNSDRLLCLGASLTDPPLISALCDSAKTDCRTFAIVKRPSAVNPSGGDENNSVKPEQLQKLISGRIRSIGVNHPLFANSYGDIAQFVEEIRMCRQVEDIAKASPNLQLSYKEGFSYSERLRNWSTGWHNWHDSEEFGNGDIYESRLTDFEELLQCCNLVVSEFKKSGIGLKQDEMIRVRCWVINSFTNTFSERLVLVANSSGIIIDDNQRPFYVLNDNPSSPAAEAFNSGRPIISNMPAYSAETSRWKSSMAVPIFHNIQTAIPELAVVTQGMVSVGAVTLESTLPCDELQDNSESSNRKTAIFGDPRTHSYPTLLRRVAKLLSDSGRRITIPE